MDWYQKQYAEDNHADNPFGRPPLVSETNQAVLLFAFLAHGGKMSDWLAMQQVKK